MRLILSSLLLLIALTTQAQRTTEANRQNWSGGIAGRHGSNFRFVVRFEGTKKDIKPDTLWIEGEAIALKDDAFERGRYKISKKGKYIYCEIMAGFAKDDLTDRYTLEPGHTESARPKPPINYKGAALLRYKENDKMKYYVIDKILSYSPPVNYP